MVYEHIIHFLFLFSVLDRKNVVESVLQNDVDVELMAMLCCCLMFPRLETIYREKLWQHFRTNDQDRRYNFKHKTNGPYIQSVF